MVSLTSDRLDQKLRRELGPLVCERLDDDRTEDIMLNPDTRLWWKGQGQPFVPIGFMGADQATSLIGTVAFLRGKIVDESRPILETELPIPEEPRFEGIIAPVVRSPIFAIRCRPRRIYSLDDYESAGMLAGKGRSDGMCSSAFGKTIGGANHREILRRAVEFRQNILVCGPTGSGKTTLLNALLHELAAVAPEDRVICIEDTIELQCSLADYVDLRALGEVTMLDCLRATMRLRPTRIVVGEVRGAEALTLVKAWNTGHPGGMATLHADHAQNALRRLESLVGEATATPHQQLIAQAIDLVVDIAPDASLGHRVQEICLVHDWRDGEYVVEYV